MTTFCESESVLRDTISSFRKGHSTNTVLMGMRDDLLRAMKKGEVTLMVLADLSKTFDTVNYKVLITKLSTLGFSKPFLRWLNSYLSDRSHFVQIDDRTSESVNVRFGVPQGSILGPMLFNLCVSDLQDHLPSSIGSFQYADDTTIYSSCPAPELQRCAQELNSTLNTVSTWSNDSHLALNSKKTKTMLLSTSQMSHVQSLDKNQPAITISDSTLEYVNVSKLLGVHFHQHLNWDEHVQATCKSCYGTIQIIRKLKNFAGYRLRKHLVESLVLSKLDYCDTVYYPLPEFHLKCLQRVQLVAASFALSRIR